MHNVTEGGADLTTSTVKGAGGDLVLLTWRPGPDSARSVEAQAEEAYAAMRVDLEERGCVPLQERVFGTLRAEPALAAGRARVVGQDGAWSVPPTFIEGAPLGHDGLAGIHVVAARGKGRVLAEGDRLFGWRVEGPSVDMVGLSDVGRRAGGRLAAGPAEEAAAALDAAEQLLAREGLSFRDVVRTWFFLRDILDWYGPFNAVRNTAFRRMGLMGPGGDGKIPASTGIEGRNARGGWCALDLVAVRPRDGGRLRMERLHSRRQNEATEYGSAFARGMALTLGDSRYVFVSGTASIDDQGQTVHQGDFEAQTAQTIDAIAAVLEGAGASLAHLQQATAFLKNPCDARSFERIAERAGLAGVPLVTTVADVCRADLLVEIDASAVVPPGRGSRR
jgi:enamine deaminase RidA (YjgF/YER057c/UK114 family)